MGTNSRVGDLSVAAASQHEQGSNSRRRQDNGQSEASAGFKRSVHPQAAISVMRRARGGVDGQARGGGQGMQQWQRMIAHLIAAPPPRLSAASLARNAASLSTTEGCGLHQKRCHCHLRGASSPNSGACQHTADVHRCCCCEPPASCRSV